MSGDDRPMTVRNGRTERVIRRGGIILDRE
jgi:hypothetical protein